MQMSYLYASDFPFQKLLQTRSTRRTIWKKTVWEKSNDAYSFSIRVQTTINHISIFTFLCFLLQCQRQRKCFYFQSASWKRHCATHWRKQRGWDLVIFDWFVLSMRMQVILDSLFARPGSASTGGGQKGEFRDWTTLWLNLDVHITERCDYVIMSFYTVMSLCRSSCR